MKGFGLFLILYLGFGFIPSSAWSDTGTYEILDYHLKLFPKENGHTKILYYQKWKVLGGHIPWITVGLANADYEILSGNRPSNLERIRPYNSDGWSGVKITLDQDYQPGETFEVEFAVLQKGLFFSTQGGYGLRFVPGWYDRAKIQKLSLELIFFADLEGITQSPEPTLLEPRRILWEKARLSSGQRFSMKVTFPRNLFPGEIELAKPSSPSKRSRSPQKKIMPLLITLGIIPLILIVVLIARKGGGKYGRGGSVSWGGTHIHRGGCVVSCACACVACACACACAGGGAAGCDRKLIRTCPLCRTCEKKDCPLFTDFSILPRFLSE